MTVYETTLEVQQRPLRRLRAEVKRSWKEHGANCRRRSMRELIRDNRLTKDCNETLVKENERLRERERELEVESDLRLCKIAAMKSALGDRKQQIESQGKQIEGLQDKLELCETEARDWAANMSGEVHDRDRMIVALRDALLYARSELIESEVMGVAWERIDDTLSHIAEIAEKYMLKSEHNHYMEQQGESFGIEMEGMVPAEQVEALVDAAQKVTITGYDDDLENHHENIIALRRLLPNLPKAAEEYVRKDELFKAIEQFNADADAIDEKVPELRELLRKRLRGWKASEEVEELESKLRDQMRSRKDLRERLQQAEAHLRIIAYNGLDHIDSAESIAHAALDPGYRKELDDDELERLALKDIPTAGGE